MILVVGLSPALQRLCFFEDLCPGEINRARRVQVSAGGKALNVMRALKHLASEACLVQVLGGETGRQVSAILEESGVEHETLWDDRAVTRICTTLIPAHDPVTELVEEAPPVSKSTLNALTQCVLERLHGARVLCLSGSLPKGVPLSWYADLVRAAENRGIPALVDAEGPVLLAALEAGPWMVKPNLQETLHAFGLNKEGDLDIDAPIAAQALRNAGGTWAMVSMGAEGAWLSGPQSEAWRIRPPTVDVLNPIGAGDTLTAGLLHAHYHLGQPVAEAAKFATACAAASCQSLKNASFDPQYAATLQSQVRMELRGTAGGGTGQKKNNSRQPKKT